MSLRFDRVWVALWESLGAFLFPLLPPLSFFIPDGRFSLRIDRRTSVRESSPRLGDPSSRTNILLPRSKKNATAITLSPRARSSPVRPGIGPGLSPDNGRLFFYDLDPSQIDAEHSPSRTTGRLGVLNDRPADNRLLNMQRA